MRRAVLAWQAGDGLVLACPSTRGGYHLIGVVLRANRLVVVHNCPAVQKGKKCWHIDVALATYREWRWWEPTPEDYEVVPRSLIMKPSWEQIPVPGYELEGRNGLERSAAEHTA